ncbi:heme/hemin ABC transporter substrate-binding protein [Rubrimonas cliftonensis]|nr:ABC transporter substrate-binding protein [Rubrimonas cliftonensis]
MGAAALALAPGLRRAFATEPARRIVSIGGAVTEIVFALGEQDRLVGRDATSTHPPEAEALPDVGYMRALSSEGVLSLRPDLIVAAEGAGPPEAVALLREAAVPFATIPEGHDRAAVAAKIRAVADALGAPERGAALAAEVDAALARAMAQAAAPDGQSPARVLFILSMQGGRVLASGRGTGADGIIALAGAVNAVDAFEGYKPLTDEAVIAAAPDVILMMDRGEGHEAARRDVVGHAALALTPAARAGRLVRLDGLLLLGFGPRTPQAISVLASALADAG